MHDLEICVELLKDFIRENLENSIENIITYDLFNTLNDKKYGELQNIGNPEKYDPDNSEIAKVIYYIVWHSKLPKIELSNIGTGKLYRGDTLNTFNTLFGRDLKKIITLGNSKKYLMERAIEFKKIYLSIGNFILLPNKTIIPKGRSKKETLNTYRGVASGWKDYFDKFLFELDICMDESTLKDKDRDLFDLYKANGFYFDEIGKMHGFVEKNYLEMYFSKDNNHLLVFNDGLRYWDNTTHDEYIQFCLKYIEISTDIIISRGKKIVNELQKYI